jgi:hypothetical protein
VHFDQEQDLQVYDVARRKVRRCENTGRHAPEGDLFVGTKRGKTTAAHKDLLSGALARKKLKAERLLSRWRRAFFGSVAALQHSGSAGQIRLAFEKEAEWP